MGVMKDLLLEQMFAEQDAMRSGECLYCLTKVPDGCGEICENCGQGPFCTDEGDDDDPCVLKHIISQDCPNWDTGHKD
jgi:hypothetical protein